MSLTTIVAKAFLARQKSLEHHALHAEALQERVLKYLIGRGQKTEYGQRYLFDAIRNYSDFARCLPINTYEEMK